MQKENFKKALIEGEIVIILKRVSKSGLTRTFKIFYYHEGQYLTIPHEIAKKQATN